MMPDINLDTLIEQLHDFDSDTPDLQFKAATVLGDVSDKNARTRVVDELIKALSERHQALTRAHAAESLGKLGDPRAVNALINALKDEYRLVRSYAARALGKLGDTTAINPLIPILGKDDFFGARAEAAEALGKLFELCKDDDPEDQIAKAAAEQALEQYRAAEEERLRKKEEEGRSRRVLAEMEIWEKLIKDIDDTLEKVQDAYKQRKDEVFYHLIQHLKDQTRNVDEVAGPLFTRR